MATRKYIQWFAELKKQIQHSQLRTALQVNKDMLLLYWYIGKQISIKIDSEGWGANVIDQLSIELQNTFPEQDGYSVRSLKYMRKFADKYPELLIVQQPAAQLKKKRSNMIAQKDIAQVAGKKATEKVTTINTKNEKSGNSVIVQQLVAQLEKNDNNAFVQQAVAQFGNVTYTLQNEAIINIPWGHHTLLLDKVDAVAERVWYIEKTIENNWSRAVLRYQLETDLYTRQFKKKKATNFHLTLPKPQSDLANQILKDPYVFQFIQIGEYANEQVLEKALIKHIQEFIVELGAGFAFVGRQVRLPIGKKERRLDLLFYHLYLRCFIVLDLKMEQFEPEHVGQINFYLNAINKTLRNEYDGPTIGIILCAEKDNVEVEFALQNINQPIGVSEYKLMKTLPKAIKDKMPTVKQLQDEVKRFLKQQSSNKKK